LKGCPAFGTAFQAIKKVPFLMGGTDRLKSCGISGRRSERGSVFRRSALEKLTIPPYMPPESIENGAGVRSLSKPLSEVY